VSNVAIGSNQHSASRGLNVALWGAQFLLFAAFVMAGFTHLTGPITELSKSMPWTGRLPEGLVRFIGVAELAGALGMILPSLARVKPILTPIAGVSLMTVMFLAAGQHLLNGEAMVLPVNLALGGLAAFVAWGRWRKAPIAAR
jgi:hypothetical protein